MASRGKAPGKGARSGRERGVSGPSKRSGTRIRPSRSGRKTAAPEGKLREYRKKRDPSRTSEPFDPGSGEGFFVVQKHAARRLHYDFRLAMGGVLVSWAIPKGPSYDTRQRRLAVHVEDHPLTYRDFEGVIPKGEYGAGSVIVWDTGPFRLREGSVASGSLKLDLFGEKLQGGWALVRMKSRGEEKEQWLLLKERDEHADPDRDVTAEEPASVLSALTVEEIAESKDVRLWNSGLRRLIEELPPGAAREAPLPRHPEFMRAKLKAAPPADSGWVFEIKLDGVRAFAIRQQRSVRLVTRNGKEVAFRYPEVTQALEAIAGEDFVMDGEIVAFDPEGRTRFELLQGRIHLAGDDRIADVARETPVFYFGFDLIYVEGYRLEEATLLERKRILARLLEGAPATLRYSDHVDGHGKRFLDLACGRGLEGILAKRADAPYRGTRSGDWIKVKCLNQQELVIGGFTPPRGGRAHFGSLLLGVYERDRLAYAGKVGTGFTGKSLADLHARLRKLARKTSPFEDPPRERGVTWVEPKLVAEVRFTEWTSDGKLRHPAFLGLREDKDPRECVRELPTDGADSRRPAPKGTTTDGKPAAARSSAERPPARAPTGRAPAPRSEERPPARAPKASPPARTSDERPPARANARARADRGTASPDGRPASRQVASRSGRASSTGRKGRSRDDSKSPAPDEVPLTNPGKVLFPQAGITKGDVVAYYRAVADVLLPHIEERPLTLVRFPNGIGGISFFQKDQPESLPDWIPTVRVRSQEGRKDVDYLICDDEPTLAYVANLGTIDLHPWASRVGALENPDYVVWDLDPPEGGFTKAAEVAPRVREVLERAGLMPFLKTSGGKGLHLYVPLRPENDHDQVREFAEVIARLVVEANPRLTTLERSKKGRQGKVYVDFMQNGRGKTVVAAYSLRAKEPATVSTPITWDELEEGVAPQDLNLRTVPELLARRGDVWRGFWENAPSLADAVDRLSSGSSPGKSSRADGTARGTPRRAKSRARR